MRYPTRKASATLLWAVAAFILLQVGLLVLTDTWWIRFRDPVYGPKIARLRQRLQPPGSDRPTTIVMIGSSRTADALNGQVSEASLADGSDRNWVVFNLGVPGAGPMQEYLNLRRLLADGVRPDLLLIEVMPALLDQRVGAVPLWMPSERLSSRDLRFLAEGKLPIQALRRSWKLDAALPWYSRRYVILSMSLPKLLPHALRQDWFRACDASGWVPHGDSNGPEANGAALQHAHDEYGWVLATFRLGGASCDALRQILETCRKSHIRAALVVMPEGSAFRSWYSSECLAQVQTFLRELQDEFGVTVINAREWLLDEDFVDSHHTHNAGAEDFSRRLARRIVLLLPDADLGCDEQSDRRNRD